MVTTRRRSARIKKMQGDDEIGSENVQQQEGPGDDGDDDSGEVEAAANNDAVTKHSDGEEEAAASSAKKSKARKKKELRRQRKEDLKSKATGVGLKISVDSSGSAPVNKKIVFGDYDEDDAEKDTKESTSSEEVSAKEDKGGKVEENCEDEDDDDAVEEVQGSAARDEVMDRMKMEEKQSLKTKKKRNRKARKEKPKPKEYGSDDEMDDEFFAQLNSVRQKEEAQERREEEKSRAAAKGKHTTFVFAQNKDDDQAPSGPIQIDENIQVVVLKDPSSSVGVASAPATQVSKVALAYSRNRLKDGSDPSAGATEAKRKRNRSGEEVQPWKRVARPRLAMGRSRMTKGKPAAFFTKKKKKR